MGSKAIKDKISALNSRRGGWVRNDGTLKGAGFFGELPRPDGRVSTEISMGVDFGDGEVEIPTLVPTLTKPEIDYLLNTDPNPKIWGTPIGESIKQKAIDHAIDRFKQNKNPFWEEGEEIFKLPIPALTK